MSDDWPRPEETDYIEEEFPGMDTDYLHKNTFTQQFFPVRLLPAIKKGDKNILFECPYSSVFFKYFPQSRINVEGQMTHVKKKIKNKINRKKIKRNSISLENKIDLDTFFEGNSLIFFLLPLGTFILASTHTNDYTC